MLDFRFTQLIKTFNKLNTNITANKQKEEKKEPTFNSPL